MYDFAPMLGQLPDSVDAMRHASQGTRLHGMVALRRCERLRPALLSDEGAIEVALTFSQDPEHGAVVFGTLRGTLQMQCQRCEQALALVINAQLQVGLVRDDEHALRLPEHLDPCLLTDNRVSLTTLVEDELILALPIVPRHEQECVMTRVVPATEQTPSTEEKRKNPFAILARLRSDKDGDQRH